MGDLNEEMKKVTTTFLRVFSLMLLQLPGVSGMFCRADHLLNPPADSLLYSLRITLEDGQQKTDEALVNFSSGYTKNFIDSTGDALKFFNPGLNIWWHTVDQYDLVINNYSLPTYTDTLLLQVKAKDEGIYSLVFSDVALPTYMSVLLADSSRNKLIDVRKPGKYRFYLNCNQTLTFKLILIPVSAVPVFVQASVDSARQVNISWTSAAEVNTAKYIVAHSTDGVNFVTIDSVMVSDTILFQQSSYSLIHASPTTGLHYYRMKKILTTGYSGSPITVQVEVKDKEPDATGFAYLTEKEIMIYPLPATSEVYVQPGQQWLGKETVFSLYNYQGKLCYTNKLSFSDRTAISLDGIAPGTYILKIVSEGAVCFRNIIKN